jgi:hypothetical protein
MAVIGAIKTAQPLGLVRQPQRDLDVDHLRVWVPGKSPSRVRADLKNLTTDAELIQSLDGASTLTLKVRDYSRHLLRSPLCEQRSTLSLDFVEYTLVKVSHTEDEITLIFEETAMNLLRQEKYSKPKKAARDNTTRAQFIRGMVAEVTERRIHFECPELTQRQPIAG